jgi:ABC-type Na+ efflux pump permease subunit
MTNWMPWKIARKELKVIGRKRSIIFYNVGLPILVAVAFSFVIRSQTANGIPDTLAIGAESIIYIFVVLATVLPSTIAAYSIVGEKVEKTLEPLLATPTTDGEILLERASPRSYRLSCPHGWEHQSSWQQQITYSVTLG